MNSFKLNGSIKMKNLNLKHKREINFKKKACKDMQSYKFPLRDQILEILTILKKNLIWVIF